MSALSARLRLALEALPLRPGLRVLEVGCGPGALARAIAAIVAPDGFVLAIDRSDAAIRQAQAASGSALESGVLSLRRCAAEDFVLDPEARPFDLIVALRVGAFDGRHLRAGARAWPRMAAALAPGGVFFVDGVAHVPDGRGGFRLASGNEAMSLHREHHRSGRHSS